MKKIVTIVLRSGETNLCCEKMLFKCFLSSQKCEILQNYGAQKKKILSAIQKLNLKSFVSF